MLGKKKYEPKLFNYVSIEELVPENNFYRKVNELLDLRFLYQECKKYYGKTGKPSIDPIVFFKFNLYGYFENIIEDRELVRQVSDSLSARLFLGYDLDEQIPWHSTISRPRGIIEEEVFEKLFNKILVMCAEAGLIEGRHQSVDSTLVKANASLDSLERKKPQLTVKEYIKQTKGTNVEEAGKELKDIEIREKPDNKRIIEQTSEDGIKKENRNEIKPIKCSEERTKKKEINKNYISKTDPDSKVASKPNAKTDLYYSTHYVVDSKGKIITDVLTVHADRSDSEILLESLERAGQRLEPLGLRIEEVGADKGFCSGKNLRRLEEKNIEGYIPSKQYVNPSGKIGKEEFKYDSQKNIYICPQGKTAKYHSTDKQKQLKRYLVNKKKREICPLKEKCCNGKRGRQISRSIYEEEYERLTQRLSTVRGKRAIRLRKINTEPLFAEAKMEHGLKKFMTRGKRKAQKNSLMIASVQNLKRLIKEHFKKKVMAVKNQEKLILKVESIFNLEGNHKLLPYSIFLLRRMLYSFEF
jgi:transposase